MTTSAPPPLPSPYLRLGGAPAVRALVETFYDLVEHEPVAEPLRQMHLRGHGIAHAREAQFLFLSQFFGGPRLFLEANRHANVREMHAHLAIDAAARDAWLVCMERALTDTATEPALAAELMTSFRRVAGLLTNTP